MKHTKWIAAACAALAFGFVACSSDDDDSKNDNNGNNTVTYIGAKKPTEAKTVGDIVFTDGSATAYSVSLTLTDEQKAAAVAVIFYAGTGLNSDDASGNADTTTKRTLGVGLTHQTTKVAWCTDTANAYNKEITAIECVMQQDKSFSGKKNGIDNLAKIADMLGATGSGTTDDTATEANYPAFYFAKNYASKDGSHVSGTDYASDWYLPSVAELYQLREAKDTVNAASELCGGATFADTASYWSSTQCEDDGDDTDDEDGLTDAYRAYMIQFSGIYLDEMPKSEAEGFACAIREF